MGVCASDESPPRGSGDSAPQPMPKGKRDRSPGVESLFKALDNGGTGHLNLADIELMLEAVNKTGQKHETGDNKDRKTAEGILTEADRDNDGLVSLTEFQQWVGKNRKDFNKHALQNLSKTVVEIRKRNETDSKLEEIWNQYKDKGEDDIMESNLPALLKELDLDPDGIDPFGFAWKLEHKRMGPILKKEFMIGLHCQGVSTWEQLHRWAKKLKIEMKDTARLREIYVWTFDYVKEDGRKTIAKDVAEFIWGLILPPIFPLYDKWTNFLEEKYELPVIKRDLWMCFFDFAVEVSNHGLDNYDKELSSWPVTIDDFYDFCSPAKPVKKDSH